MIFDDKLAKAELLVNRWLMDDFFDPTRREVTQWLHEGKYDEIISRLSGEKRLVFGTAGLRARMGAGYDRMNTLTVMLATQGLIDFLGPIQTTNDTSLSPVVIIGFDGRHNSESFAHVTASLFLMKGYCVKMLDRPSPTPFNPFLVSQTPGAVCGIQITASHNPKMDNGYKLYWSNGAQIIPPIDSGIAKKMDENFGKIWIEVFQDILDPKTCRIREEKIPSDQLEMVFDSVLNDYAKAIVADVSSGPKMAASRLKFAYTAMHGVGYKPFRAVFSAFGFDPDKGLCPVPEQIEIDPEFPTVPFPNPEEKGALKLVILHAEKNACEIVLANDPDADRFTSVEKQKDGSWYQFTGDELGLLFCDWRMRTMNEEKNGLVVSSVVSSRMAAALCRVRGFQYSDCLTGFKWIANESIRVREEAAKKSSPLKHLLGYEEAIGYQVSSVVPDKDGISAGCVWAEMAMFWRMKEGKTLKERFDEILEKEIGFFVTNNGYYVIEDPAITGSIFAEFRATGMTEIGGKRIKCIRDVTRGIDTGLGPGEVSHLPKTPDAEMITIFFENGAVVTIRSSGTEPKVKYYSEMSSRESVAAARRELDEIVAIIKRDFYKPNKFPMKEQPVM